MSVEKSSSGRYNPPCRNLVDVDKDFDDFEPFEGAHGAEATPRAPAGYKPLTVRKVDMCQHINKPYHHTAEYETPNLVVRRGQRFIIQVHFSRRLTSDDDFQMEFLIGNSPAPDKGSLVAVTFNQRRGGSWRGELLEERDTVLTLGITPTPDAIVGKFRTYVAIVGATGMQRTKRDPTTDLYLLFNAWCPYDAVFVADENERMEYVLNEHGMIITGSVQRVSSRRWEYGQFERGVLDACIYILDRSRMPIFSRSSVIKVVRKASAMINAQDDNGVLVGNWSDNYDLGTPPGAWTGSVPILLKYANSGVPVNFAQCWVYAGVLNTFLRCLGIPARLITNFCSAHDNTGNLKTDLIFGPDGTPDHRNTRDSIWNFHCWNEVFIQRDDIPKKYSGWQVVDSTPQETSDGLYRCGPASVAAIKDGQIMHPFDCGFVFAEVNSDVVFHKRDKYGTLKVTRVDKTWVGQAIYTKAVGAFTAVEITGNYKYPEGSPSNDKSMEEAENYGLARDHSEVSDGPVVVYINCGPTFVSQNVELDVIFRNSGSVPKTVDAHLDVNSIFYTGTPYEHCKDEWFTVNVPANETLTRKFTVTADEYLPRLGSGSSLQVIVTGEVGDQTVSNVQTITLQMPKLHMTVSGKPQVNQNMEVTVSFQNPLRFTLERARILVEGNGLLELKTHKYRAIEPNGQISFTESFRPRRAGLRTIVAVMVCDNLDEVRGSVDLNIEPVEEWSALLHPGSSRS